MPKVFADSITFYYMDIKDEDSFGRNGEKYALTVVDRATKWSRVFPCKDKTMETVCDSLREFLGPGVQPKHLYSDNAGEFKAAVKALGWAGLHDLSTQTDPRRTE